jgi:hypothetical protein
LKHHTKAKKSPLARLLGWETIYGVENLSPAIAQWNAFFQHRKVFKEGWPL